MNTNLLQLSQRIICNGNIPLEADPPKFSIGDIANFLVILQNWIIIIVAIVAVGMIIYAGYMYMLSQGDAGKIKQAQGTITWAVIGLVFVFIVRMVLGAVVRIVGN